jgi:hypothetical protein
LPLFQVHRDITGWSNDDLEAAAIRTQTCAAWFDGMRWIRSFLNPEEQALLCYYEAASEGDVRRHAQAAEVPCGRVIEVREVLPLALEPPTAP